MLTRLLELVQRGGVHRLSDLARELDTTPALVQLMLDDLARMGYLEHSEQGCQQQCKGCSVKGACATGSEGRVWTLA